MCEVDSQEEETNAPVVPIVVELLVMGVDVA
jgi:hypothetical protein